ncbi:basic helix-loop-helix protein [Lunasporangiospora selenospora]|uniref:Basic helix-loop-helix protein n=1 Tax=Lunasporangiospora selenospora TaxID=979761 RepID=A0A9P6FYV0_9FUNG|nr:basic helix-loop-helix protein [Lunasporangiospora selenospora]
MTLSSEIQSVQEVLNNLTNSIKSDTKLGLDDTFSSVIAQHNLAQAVQQAAQAAAQEAQNAQKPQAKSDEESQELVSQPQGQENQSQTAQSSQHHHQPGPHEELERIAQQHQQEQQHHQDQDQHQYQQQQDDSIAAQVIHVNSLESDSSSTLATVSIAATTPAPAVTKPVPGSDEWHRLRKDNHKEVERRRRENINDGITEISKMVPSSEKNKGSILKEAVKYIRTLQETNRQLSIEAEATVNLQFEKEKAILEKSVAETELQNLTARHEILKREYEELRQQVDEQQAAKKLKTEQ